MLMVKDQKGYRYRDRHGNHHNSGDDLMAQCLKSLCPSGRGESHGESHNQEYAAKKVAGHAARPLPVISNSNLLRRRCVCTNGWKDYTPAARGKQPGSMLKSDEEPRGSHPKIMSTPAAGHPATARDIILEIIRNMREGLEPLHYTTLPPAIYHVYLHPDDFERLRGIFPRMQEETRQALDAELADMNRASLGERLKLARKPAAKVVAPDGGWRVQFFPNSDDDVAPGDIVIYSELALPAKPEFGAGSMTKRINTRRMSGETTATQKYEEQLPATKDMEAYATIEYEDKGGGQTYRMTKNQIVIGRGGRDYWTDLKLATLPDVSREHVRLRRDAETGEFFIKDLSRLGTSVNGDKIPTSVEFVEGEKRDKNVEVKLPAEARIGLADVVFLEFHAAGKA